MTSRTDSPSNLQLLINGVPTAASNGETIDVLSPADGRVVGSVPAATSADLETALQAAQDAFAPWSGRSAYERQKIIVKAAAHARSQADAIGRLMALEQGKPLAQSVGEVHGACDTLEYFAAEGVRAEGYSNPTEKPELRSHVIYQPVGICSLITPWNYPVALLSWKLGPALASGCVAVVKPTTITPLSPTAFCMALVEGGIPPGVLSVLSGRGSDIGEGLVTHPLVKKVAMTGSSATGKRILAAVATQLKKVTLELGGQCPAVVCADADLDLAAKIIAYKGFRNCGQSCSAINRVYAHRSVHDALVEKLARIAEGLSIGDGISDPQVDLGPMATQDGPETCRRHIEDALAKGATLAFGGDAPKGDAFAKGHYFRPTILTGCTHEMIVTREETFGPVVAFMAYDEDQQAVDLANDSDYGLVAYLFTKDYARTVRLSEALEAGTVCVNNGAVNTNYGPYAGWKDSGYGLELSRHSILEYLKPKHIKTAL